ncbi:digestive cysteine proteinase 2-like [Tachypleus tridentatus]|uniref:digestive cysteine proteinase 2-like n=1 Tax=Tachypleus tridentatus TaxID=6853 RepID=UPI003FD152CE
MKEFTEFTQLFKRQQFHQYFKNLAQYVVDEFCENTYFQIKTLCSRWEFTEIYGKKVNKYTMWVLQNDTIPIRYQMKGYNSLLGSHYDKYEIYYGNFTTDVSDLVFNISKNLTCRSFPGPGLENVGEHNPIKEFIDKHDYHINQAFEDFKQTHDKKYKNEKHHETRKNIFRQNYRFIKSTNRASKTYSVKVNHLADLTDSEMRILRGRLPTRERNNGRPFDKSNYNPNIPETLDWRLYGAVTPVKDQAVCGSCWSFGTTGTIEGAYFLKTGNLVHLSQQQLIDCSWSNQNNGCDGGEDFRAYDYIIKSGGLATEEDYGPYLGQDGKCHDRNVNKTVQITGYVNVTSKDPDLEALRLSLVYNGPISVSIDASHKSFSFYSNGVYWEPKCGNKSDDLDHSVLAVGYGTLNGQPYWLIKNSWSTYWGNDGYVLMSQQDNNCGVATSPTFVLM